MFFSKLLKTARGHGVRGSGPTPGMAALCLVLLIAAPGCGGSSGGGGDDPIDPDEAEFTSSGTAAAPNRIRLTGAALDDSTILVEVVLDGPTTSSDLYSFAFDLLLSNASVAQFLNGSEVLGTVLQPNGGQGDDLLVSRQGNRVVIGATLTGGGIGDGVGAGSHVILSLRFNVPDVGMTTVAFSGSPNPQNPSGDPAVLDSTGAIIQSIVFDASAARISK